MSVDEQEAGKDELYAVRMPARDGGTIVKAARELAIGDTDAIHRGPPRRMLEGRVQSWPGGIICEEDELDADGPKFPGERIERRHGRDLERAMRRPQRDDRRRTAEDLRRYPAAIPERRVREHRHRNSRCRQCRRGIDRAPIARTHHRAADEDCQEGAHLTRSRSKQLPNALVHLWRSAPQATDHSTVVHIGHARNLTHPAPAGATYVR